MTKQVPPIPHHLYASDQLKQAIVDFAVDFHNHATSQGIMRADVDWENVLQRAHVTAVYFGVAVQGHPQFTGEWDKQND